MPHHQSWTEPTAPRWPAFAARHHAWADLIDHRENELSKLREQARSALFGTDEDLANAAQTYLETDGDDGGVFEGMVLEIEGGRHV